MTLVSKHAPDFTSMAVMPDGNIIKNFNLKTYTKNTITVVFFWPMDFTFVCPSELIAFDKRYQEFINRDVKIVGISCDSAFVHQAWRKTSINSGGIGNVKYPMISDIKREIQKAYGIEHPVEGVALRASFLIDANGIIRHQIVNDLPFGRNIDEMIRMIDALIFHEKNGEVCPAQWIQGKKTITPSAEGIANYLSKYSQDL